MLIIKWTEKELANLHCVVRDEERKKPKTKLSKGYGRREGRKCSTMKPKEAGLLLHPGIEGETSAGPEEERRYLGGERRERRRGWTNLIHLPVARAAATLPRTLHLPCYQNLGNYERKTEVCCLRAGATRAAPACRRQNALRQRAVVSLYVRRSTEAKNWYCVSLLLAE